MRKFLNNDNILEMHCITKKFPGVVALKNVNFELKQQEIHAVIGENGAGKSTLMKILSGVYPYGTFEGEIIFRGKKTRFLSPRDAKDAGISIVYQEIVIVPDLTVGENIYLGAMPRNRFGILNWNHLHSESEKLLRKLGLEINSQAIIRTLTVGEQQLVQIAKAIKVNPVILILDEPTSSLTETETENLFKLINVFCRGGGSCIYISHIIEEVEEISNRVTVLRDGEKIETQITKQVSKSDIISMIVGREIKDMYPKSHCKIGEVIFSVENLSQKVSDIGRDAKRLKDISLDLRSGEILGIAGLLGSGRTELCMGMFGTLPDIVSGSFFINGEKIDIRSPVEAIQRGIVLLTENRREFGLVHTMSTLHNISLSSITRYSRFMVINHEREMHDVNEMIERLLIKVPTLETIVENLSGGNQQKVLFARWILTHAKIFILDEPTKGIDVGSKVGIFNIINSLVDGGAGIILVSSELPELLGICDRILVMKDGKINGEFSHNEFLAKDIIHCEMGQKI
jgi:D-xylose transport system ATP-binding protein